MADRLAAELELRASESGPRVRATLIQEGRASTGSRRELFTPGAVQWPGEGVELRTEHLAKAETRAVPTREADGRIVIDACLLASPLWTLAASAGRRGRIERVSAQRVVDPGGGSGEGTPTAEGSTPWRPVQSAGGGGGRTV